MESALSDDFRSAMRRFASTVTIVSSAHDGVRHGMTATAVTSVSMDPPSVLVCVNRSGRLHELMGSCRRFCINVLHADQSGVSRIFAQAPSGERFSHGDWLENEHGVPYLSGAQVTVFCRRSLVVPYGSHTVFFGDVEQVDVREDISPLIYQNGDYGTYGPLRTAR
jgi:flavin reductase (DIM6/NTAB) family NADH-FMN oxidoreductase RutF